MALPAFVAEGSLSWSHRLHNTAVRFAPDQSRVRPAACDAACVTCWRSCFADCRSATGGSKEHCTTLCTAECGGKPADNPPPICWDEPDPNYHWCLGGVKAWELACIVNPLTPPPVCQRLADEMRKTCYPTRRVCQ